MSKLKDLIKNIKVEIASGEQSTFVYYDKESGNILRLCGTKDDAITENESLLEVPYQYASPMLSGKKRTSDYIVIYDTCKII